MADTAVYVSGAIGAAEIIGDSNNDVTYRIRFDGKDFPLKDNSKRPAFTIERTYAIGRDVAKAVVEALERGEWSDVPAIEVRKAELRVPMDNKGYVLLAQKGVLDIPPAGLSEVRTWVYVITMGEAQMITTPGELFPEVFYGVEKYRRRDCP